MSDGRQRHQHGVKKKLAEGFGGLRVGAALVLLLRGLVRRRPPAAPAHPAAASPPADNAAAG